MSPKRWLLALLGVAIWAVGLWLFVDGAYVGGGLLILLGGLVLVIAASGGWSEFVEGLTNCCTSGAERAVAAQRTRR
jgi:hypothetical protein